MVINAKKIMKGSSKICTTKGICNMQNNGPSDSSGTISNISNIFYIFIILIIIIIIIKFIKKYLYKNK